MFALICFLWIFQMSFIIGQVVAVGNTDCFFSSTSYWARFKSSEFKYLIMSLRVACDIQALRIINLFCQNRPIFHRGRKPTVCMSCTQLRSLLNDAFPRVLWLQKSWAMVTSQLFCKNIFFLRKTESKYSPSQSIHWVLGGLLTFKKIDRSWDMCFLVQNDMGNNVY